MRLVRCILLLFVYSLTFEVIRALDGYNATNVPGQCPTDRIYFDCTGDGSACVDFLRIRDCVDDCSNAGDERCPNDFVKCELWNNDCGRCVEQAKQKTECADQKYEYICNNPASYPCQSTSNCFLKNWIGDGVNQCFDWSDEDPCYTNTSSCIQPSKCEWDYVTKVTTCPCPADQSHGDGFSCTAYPLTDRLPGLCQSGQFDCGNQKCIPDSWLHDCRENCASGVDEQCFDSQQRCPDMCQCVPAGRTDLCTGTVHSNCARAQKFACTDGRCIADSKVLDGVEDCSDGSDENYCTLYQMSCPTNFPCSYVPYTHSFQCGCPDGMTTAAETNICQLSETRTLPKDCADLQAQGKNSTAATYTVYGPRCTGSASECQREVVCDFQTFGGGWTVIQYRFGGETDFWQNWTDYKAGFGDLNREFWIGNEYIYELTNQKPFVAYMIGIEIRTWPSDANNQNGEVYQFGNSLFRLDDEVRFYAMRIGGLASSLNSSAQDHATTFAKLTNNLRFGTWDVDTDSDPSVTCGNWWRSGWWFRPRCEQAADMNTEYFPRGDTSSHNQGIQWPGLGRLQETKIQIRPVGYQAAPHQTGTAHNPPTAHQFARTQALRV